MEPGEWEALEEGVDHDDDEAFIAQLREEYGEEAVQIEDLEADLAYLADKLFKAEASRDAYRIMMDQSNERFVEQLYKTKRLEYEVSELTKLITGYRWVGRPEGVGPDEPVVDMQIGGIEIDYRDPDSRP
jgi:hypothetical protein